MKVLSQRTLATIILRLNWSGHVELPVCDVEWLSAQLHNVLYGSNAAICDSCRTEALIIVRTPLGPICSDCLDDFNQEVETMRATNA